MTAWRLRRWGSGSRRTRVLSCRFRHTAGVLHPEKTKSVFRAYRLPAFRRSFIRPAGKKPPFPHVTETVRRGPARDNTAPRGLQPFDQKPKLAERLPAAVLNQKRLRHDLCAADQIGLLMDQNSRDACRTRARRECPFPAHCNEVIDASSRCAAPMVRNSGH